MANPNKTTINELHDKAQELRRLAGGRDLELVAGRVEGARSEKPVRHPWLLVAHSGSQIGTVSVELGATSTEALRTLTAITETFDILTAGSTR